LRDSVPFWEIMDKALSRQERGVSEYGDGSYQRLDLMDEIEEELLDQIVYSYLQILKNRGLKHKIKEAERLADKKTGTRKCERTTT
jgi:hypothetical protein